MSAFLEEYLEEIFFDQDLMESDLNSMEFNETVRWVSVMFLNIQ